MLQLAQHDGMAQMQIGSGRIHAQLHAQRFARLERPFQLGAQFGLADDFRGALLEIRELFVDRREVDMGKDIIRNAERKAEARLVKCTQYELSVVTKGVFRTMPTSRVCAR